jgi:hypothetical protein
MNLVFANHSDKDVIYPLTVKGIVEAQEIAEAQETDPNIYNWPVIPNTSDSWWKTHKYCVKVQPWSFLLPFNIE